MKLKSIFVCMLIPLINIAAPLDANANANSAIATGTPAQPRIQTTVDFSCGSASQPRGSYQVIISAENKIIEHTAISRVASISINSMRLRGDHFRKINREIADSRIIGIDAVCLKPDMAEVRFYMWSPSTESLSLAEGMYVLTYNFNLRMGTIESP